MKKKLVELFISGGSEARRTRWRKEEAVTTAHTHTHMMRDILFEKIFSFLCLWWAGRDLQKNFLFFLLPPPPPPPPPPSSSSLTDRVMGGEESQICRSGPTNSGGGGRGEKCRESSVEGRAAFFLVLFPQNSPVDFVLRGSCFFFFFFFSKSIALQQDCQIGIVAKKLFPAPPKNQVENETQK